MKKEKIQFTSVKIYPVDTESHGIVCPEELLSSGLTSIEGSIPGNIELDMQSAGMVPELFFGTNILCLEEYELYDFWYRCTFRAGEDYDTLTFEGIDTLAEIWLNGKKIGEADNMFIPHSFPIRGLCADENELWVRIKSAVRYADEQQYDVGLWGPSYNAQSVHIRKAPHSFGWDICPRAMLGGIFKDVYLASLPSVAIEEVYFNTESVGYNGATVNAVYDLNIPSTLYHKATVEFEGRCNDAVFVASERIEFKHGMFTFLIDAGVLRLWNPKGYGEPNVYTVTARIKAPSGEILAESTFPFGVRTVEIDFDRKGEEKHFLVKVSGTPVMIKGTNWVPLDAFHSRDVLRMQKALALLDEVGCNAVRCWGGGIYEDEAFFRFCDEKGILVWQDFMMACNVYPSTQEFYKKLQREIPTVVKRIRKHPSLACYCGDNECDLGMFFHHIDPTCYKVTREFIPELLFRFDPFRAYLPSSPYFVGRALAERDENALAENHLWGPRNSFKSKFYVENKNVFISEIGYHGCPSAESIRRFIPEASLWPWENDDWMVHQTVAGGVWFPEWNRIKLMAWQVRELFGKEADSLEELSICSQISQAEALKFFVEYTRLSKWKKTGIMWWNLLDCWPQFSDAVVDYYFDKKLAFEYLKRVQRPLCFMVEDAVGWDADCTVGNDGSRSYTGRYEIFDGLNGRLMAEGSFHSPANQNVTVCTLPLSKSVTSYFILKLTVGEEVFFNHYVHFGGPLKKEEYLAFLDAYRKMQQQ
ncbi:MAG: hypothetical protein IJF71_02385 [Clostridia bacterium]|nr:hypothetical protein [Clostridia bacterium]